MQIYVYTKPAFCDFVVWSKNELRIEQLTLDDEVLNSDGREVSETLCTSRTLGKVFYSSETA